MLIPIYLSNTLPNILFTIPDLGIWIFSLWNLRRHNIRKRCPFVWILKLVPSFFPSSFESSTHCSHEGTLFPLLSPEGIHSLLFWFFFEEKQSHKRTRYFCIFVLYSCPRKNVSDFTPIARVIHLNNFFIVTFFLSPRGHGGKSQGNCSERAFFPGRDSVMI